MEERIPDYLWSPVDNWSRLKGIGRILLLWGSALLLTVILSTVNLTALWGTLSPVAQGLLFISGVQISLALLFYLTGLLGMRMQYEQSIKG